MKGCSWSRNPAELVAVFPSGSSSQKVARLPWGKEITASGLLVPPDTPSRESNWPGNSGPADQPQRPVRIRSKRISRVIPGSAPRMATGPKRA